ncbi:DUF1249 domain-containing protein [Candidatus Methylomicrobium oryzae]|jgi:uncharacterized protein YqiB (DUF1249 family)|uniref:DUF1249 domain-containing protein n=1 Tax=Candidatus Methylomicrobium oryzae TaxID=2802053 RepID=UPI0019226517|nr:DUF1249 domain-containing protein [Methylomicrobium sp. RS1]MBL1265629.1 DUF1249 domain-containing protein [Methylomicrobium sp. RS1]
MSQLNPVNKSFCLEQICAANYQKLLRLIPHLFDCRDTAIGVADNSSALHLEVLERSPYTLTILLSHSFKRNLEEFLEPAVTIRLYLDLQLAEVISDHARAAVAKVYRNPGLSLEIMNYKWRLNYFLQKWLEHCLNKNYRFSSENIETTVIA